MMPSAFRPIAGEPDAVTLDSRGYLPDCAKHHVYKPAIYHVPCSGKSLLENPTLIPISPLGIIQFWRFTSQ
jgi:hypothetical protein